jgi:hypothetical protein
MLDSLNRRYPEDRPVERTRPKLVEKTAVKWFKRAYPERYEFHRDTLLTLNGMAEIRRPPLSANEEENPANHPRHPAEAEAFEFINSNIEGNPVILEYPGSAYKYESRVSTYTGLPTLLGWQNHESIWRRGLFWDEEANQTRNWQKTGERKQDVERIYRAANLDEVESLIDEYGIEYIFVGDLERKHYPAEALDKFRKLPRVYPPTDAGSDPPVVIYRTGEESSS